VLTPAQAEELIGQHLQCLPIESLPLAQCAGAVLRENIYAERDAPPFDRVSMDGIALDSGAVSEGVRRLHIQATQAAGDSPLVLGSRTACIEVMTGAVLPTGCDSVVPVEEIAIRDGHAERGQETHRVHRVRNHFPAHLLGKWPSFVQDDDEGTSRIRARASAASTTLVRTRGSCQ